MRKILFVELLGGIGDVLIALPAIQAVSRTHPAAVTVFTLPPGGELLESELLIHRVVYADGGKPRKSLEVLLARQLFDLIEVVGFAVSDRSLSIQVPDAAKAEAIAQLQHRLIVGTSYLPHPASKRSQGWTCPFCQTLLNKLREHFNERQARKYWANI